MEEFFHLLASKPTNELLFLFDLKEGVNYKKEDKGGIPYYKVFLNSDATKVLQEVIKDIDIFVPKVNKYLQSYIFGNEIPSKSIVNVIDCFTSDELFLPYISTQRVYRAQLKHCPHLLVRRRKI